MSIVFENKLEIIVFLPDGRARRRGRSPTHCMRCSGDITPNDPQILLPLFYRSSAGCSRTCFGQPCLLLAGGSTMACARSAGSITFSPRRVGACC